MNRPIKFRVWDKVNKKMHDLGTIEEIIFTRTCEDILQQAVPDALKDQFDFIEYTGLKDKNGVEIWEGDIAKSRHYSKEGEYVVFSWDEELLTFKGNVYSDGIECEDIFFIRSDSKKYEVIGNIFEHPELISKD